MDNLKRLQTYMGVASGWYETDDSCMQHCRKVTEDEYDLIQLIWLDTTEGDSGYPDREHIVVAAHIDLLETNWELAISGYYESLQQMQECYDGLSIEELKPLIAECAFENLNDVSEYDFVSGMLTRQEAENLIEEYIGFCNNTTLVF